MTRAMTVVKLGGSLLDDATLQKRAIEAIARRWRKGEPLVVVHGRGKNIDAALSRLGIPKKTHQGLRITDGRTLQVVIEVLTGSVNKSLIAELAAYGVNAVGISGADGGTLMADVHPPVDGIDLGFVGKIHSARPHLIEALLNAQYLPVIASVAAGTHGGLLNVNADAAAAAIAAGLGAARLVFLTDVEGLKGANGQLVPQINMSKGEELLHADFVTGGMKPKLRACLDAVHGGVGEVVIAGPETHTASLHDGKGGTHVVAA